MADILRSGATWLAGTLSANASQTVTYRRGSTSNAAVPATIGRLNLAFTSPLAGVSLQRDDLDFIVRVADLTISGTAIQPQQGDLIDYNGRRYLVIRPDETTPPAERDEDGLTWRVHTKFRAVI